MLQPVLLVLLGLVALVGGGDLLVRGAVRIGLLMGLSPLVVGLTVVAFGTSAPELAASLAAAFEGAPGVVLGTIAGSNLANLALILGASALVSAISTHPSFVRREAVALVLSTAALVIVAWDGSISRLEGGALVLGLAPYLWMVRSNPEVEGEAAEDKGTMGPGLAVLLVVVGIGLLAGGAHFFVGGAVQIARALGVSERLIGLTLVALGTSLPELFSSLVAAAKGHGDLVVGNVVGSNVLNVLAILGPTAVLRPVQVEEPPTSDLVAVAVVTVVAIALLVSGQRLGRLEGLAMLAGYGVVVALVFA